MTHKQAALDALRVIQATVALGQMMTDLEWRQLAAAVAYVRDEVEVIQELKRPRRAPAVPHAQVVRHDEGGEA